MAVNKVIYDGDTLVDLTGDSVTPETLAKGVTAHAADGTRITGLLPAVSITDVTTSNADSGSNVVTFSDGTTLTVKNGSKGSKGDTGSQGAKGDKGDTGANGTSVTVTNVSTSSADGGSNVVTFSDGKTLTVKNGSKGSKGDTGSQGAKGDKGDTGANGISATHSWSGTTLTITSASGTSSANLKGDKGDKGDSGANGKDGTSVTVASVNESAASLGLNYVTFSDGKTLTVRNGRDGTNGKTPVKGTDFFTEVDKAEIVARVVAQIKDGGVIGYVDANNNIVLSGNLSDGTYSIKYEIEDGSTLDVGNLVIGEVEEEIINQIRNSVNADGTPYGTNGYQSGTRISSSDGSESAVAGHCATGFIPVTSADKVYIKGITYTSADKPRFAVYNSSKTNLASSSFEPTGYGWASESNGVWTIDVKVLKSSGVAFFRFSAIGFTDETIITINQPLS